MTPFNAPIHASPTSLDRSPRPRLAAALRQTTPVCGDDWGGKRWSRQSWGGIWERIAESLDGLFSRWQSQQHDVSPTRERFVPRLTPLEPRIVLNATAELSAASGLLIFGDLANDEVHLQTVGAGDEIQLTDGNGTVIPISGHTGGATGDPSDPLAVSEIAGGQVTIDLGGGDDLLRIELPDGINLDVVDGGGDDRVTLEFQPVTSPSPATDIDITAETIELSPSGTSIQFADRDVTLNGGVRIGAAPPSGLTQIDVGSGAFNVDGTVTLDGSVRLIGGSGEVDWRDAITSASSDSTRLFIEFDPSADSLIRIGQLDASDGSLVDDVRVAGATEVELLGDVEIRGTLSLDAMDATTLQGDVSAGTINLRSNQILASGAVVAETGSIVMVATDQLSITGTVDTSAAGLDGSVSLNAPNVLLSDASITSAGGNVLLGGNSSLVGEVLIQTGLGATVAGDVTWFGPVVSDASMAAGRLTIDATGSSQGGYVDIRGNVGGFSQAGAPDLAAFVVAADELDVRDISVDGGDVVLSADQLRLFGASIRSFDTSAGVGGNLELTGDVVFQQALSQLTADQDLLLDGDLRTLNSDDQVSLSAGDALTLRGTFSGGDRLSLEAQAAIRLDADLTDWQDITLAAGGGTQVVAAAMSTRQILADGSVTFQNAVEFETDTLLRSADVQFDPLISVQPDRVVQLDAMSIVSQDVVGIEKHGDGTLVVVHDTTSDADFVVIGGTLRVDGSISGDATVDVQADGVLSGSGTISGAVTINGGSLAPDGFTSGAATGQPQFGSLTLDRDAVFVVDVDGPSAGDAFDSVGVTDQPIDLGGALLRLDITTALPGDTELLILHNDSSQSVMGRFYSEFDADGNRLATPRELFEGARILTQFGPGADAVPAFITYFGGDGNDVAIVTAGDHVQTVDKVTLVDRNGVNLEIRSGDSFADAQTATPTIRPIAGMNGGTLILDATIDQSQLYIDVDGFVGTGATPLHFDADIVFDTSQVMGDGAVWMIDSDRGSVDSPKQFDIVYQTAGELRLTARHAPSFAPDYDVTLIGVSQVDLQLPTSVLSARLTAADDQLVVQPDADPSMSRWQLTSGGLSGELTFEAPADGLSIDGGGGDDRLQFSGFSQDFRAVPVVVGGSGNDQLIWDADFQFGSPGVVRGMRLEAESVTIDGDLTLVGGGDVQIVADDQLVIRSIVDASDGHVVIDSDAPISDLSLADLRSAATDDAVSLHGGDYRLGQISAPAGTLVLGRSDGLGEIGSVEQAAGAKIDAARVTAVSSGDLDLGSITNAIGEVDLSAAQAVVVRDGADDLLVFVSAADAIDVQVAGDLRLGSAVTTGGPVTLVAAGNVVAEPGQGSVNVAGDVVLIAAGELYPGQSNMPGAVASIGSAAVPINVVARQSFSATTSGTGGSIFVASDDSSGIPSATGALPIGLVDAGDGRIQIDAVTIDDADSDNGIDLIGREILLNARSGIGAADTLKVTGLSDLQAVTDQGAIRLDIRADGTVTLSRVFSGGAGEILIRHAGDDRLSVGQVTNADGDVSVLTESASIDVLSQPAGAALSAAGAGDILLQNLVGQSDITVRGEITSDQGDVTLAARRNIVFTPSGNLTSTDGSVRLTAGNAADSQASTIALQDGSWIDAGRGTAFLQVPGNLFVSSVRSAADGLAIQIESAFGSLVDAGDQHVDLVAESGRVQIEVADGIGDGNAIETEIKELVATVQQAGVLEIAEGASIELVDVRTSDGRIEIVATGDIVAHQVRSENASGLDGDEHRDVRLVTTAADSDIMVGSIVAATRSTSLDQDNVTDVDLVAGDDVLSFGADSLVVADDLSVTSGNATGDGSDAIRLVTNVNDLVLRVDGITRGDAQIQELDSIRLASSDRNDDREVLSTTNGEIRIHAGDSIRVSDAMLVADLDSLQGDEEIVAGGANGRIRLQAERLIHLGDLVQIDAGQSSAGAVMIDAPEIVLGRDFQIETGGGVGVARIFATRPRDGLSDTAFYDATTVTTNRLEQAAVNDATGVLTVQIGNEGERGLTINIDWGAATQRFQQIDSLSGDAPPLQVEHLYLEPDILDSRFNGRTSATDPLQVRFSVRHHESILVTGQTIQQADSEVQLVEGELISSTDNPLTADGPQTPVLENGTAQFIIPSLTIPVAFFPVRDVIPTIEQAPVVVSSEQTFVVLGGSMETTEVVASTTIVREEYFQIRVRSPDPQADDLVPPTRLPDDIISGDQLKKLFESLPDGRYEIQYVLGDGNVRSILSVDLRDGKPILPGDAPDGGALRLVPVDPDADLEDRDEQQDQDAQQPGESGPDPNQSSSFDPSRPRTDHADRVDVPPPSDINRDDRFSVAGRFRARLQPSGPPTSLPTERGAIQ
ncbi:hypothetical protein [Stieleria mannarensis]|uniref:hypothetical protein n=1 Tax=Stieleria mannarensis TaxID=2755585 RepID=UPI0016046FD1|nr:hypothetical protein [Rhodopirellula sp. JC639]